MDSWTSEDERLSSISSGKKVRFDLNDEVFEIPNKWDRLSTRATARRNKLVEEVCKNGKGKVSDLDRRGKNKHSKNRKAKKTVKKFDSKSCGTLRTLASPSNQVLSLDCSVLSTEITPQKGGVQDKNSAVDNQTKKITKNCTPEVKLKLSHRASIDIPSNDIVLPKISYNSDLKKAIENAVVRNRNSSQEAGGSLNTSKTRYRLSPQELFDAPNSTKNRRTSENVILIPTKRTNPPRRSSSTEELNYSTRKAEHLLALPEYEPKFSELSRDVESWIPFAAGENKDTQQRKSKRDSSIQPAWMIPNSILY